MSKQQTKQRITMIKGSLLAAVLAGVGVFSGCGDGGSGAGGSSPKIAANISGLVNDVAGPVPRGQIEVKDNTGAVVSSEEFLDGRYKIHVPATASYPIMLIAIPPQESVHNQPIRAVVTSSIADRMDISPVSEAVVDGAITLGGLTLENIAKASGGAIGMRQSQGVSAATGGGGAGPGNSGGGAGRGGHAGHNMDAMPRDAKEGEQPPAK